jgi:hypothetical protein
MLGDITIHKVLVFTLVSYEHQFFYCCAVAQDIENTGQTGHSAQQEIVLSASLFGHF